jgi:very-short-patch-repair endonuclease
LIVLDQRGRFVGRADLGHKRERYLIEYDGTDHWEQRRADDRRRYAMRELGWKVLVVSRDDYYKTPQQVVETVRRELANHREPTKEGD